MARYNLAAGITFLLNGALYLYGGILIADYFKLPSVAAFAFPILLFILQYISFPLILDRVFTESGERTIEIDFPLFASLLKERAARSLKKGPRLGIHPSSFPFTCTYGHCPEKSRIILSQGLLDLLSDEEKYMVLLHEFHHARSGDFLVFMCTGLIPYLLYNASRFTLFMGVGMATMKGTRSLSSFGLMLWWIKNLLYTLLYFASRGREAEADRFATGKPGVEDAWFSLLEKTGKAQESSLEITINTERMAFALNFLSLADPFPGYYDKLSRDIENKPESATSCLWSSYFEIFSSHPYTENRHLLLKKRKGEASLTVGDKVKPQGRKELVLFFLPLFMTLAGSLPALMKGGLLGLPFILGGLSMIVLLKHRYPRLVCEGTLPLHELSPGPQSALRGIPVRTEGLLAMGESLALNPLLSPLQQETACIPLVIRAFYPAESILLLHSEAVEVTGWLRNDPFCCLEAATIKKKKVMVYCSLYPALLFALSWGSLIFGIFLLLLQFKGG
jgi:Zn-dependent protease with chaperone function